MTTEHRLLSVETFVELTLKKGYYRSDELIGVAQATSKIAEHILSSARIEHKYLCM